MHAVASNKLALRNQDNIAMAFDMLRNFEDRVAQWFNRSGAEQKAESLTEYLESNPMGELFRKAKEGDDKSKQMLNQIVNQLAYSDPRSLLSTMKMTNDTVKEASRSLTVKALRQLFYAMMLTRGTTQAAAFAGTAVRMMAEPVIGGITTSAGDLIKGDIDGAYRKLMVGWAQFSGGWNSASASMSAFRRALKSNAPINSGSRFRTGAEMETLELQRSRGDLIYRARLKELAENGSGPAEYLSAHLSHMVRVAGYNPYVNYGPRLLQAQDEGWKVLRASQIAQADAMIRTLDEGQGLKNLKKNSVQSFKDVFNNGRKTGEIRMDTDLGVYASESGRRMTFQRALPPIDDANFFDRVFIGIDQASETSGLFKYFNPFIRMGWDVTSQTFSQFPGVNAVYSRHFGRKAKQILDDAKKPNATAVQKAKALELESGYAVANVAGMGAAFFAWQGLMTGSDPAINAPRDSFLIPLGDGNHMAIDYSRFEPYATWMRMIADSVDDYRRGNISRGEYEEGIATITGSMATSTLDKNILAGVVDMTEIFNYRNWNGGSAHTILAGMVGFTPAIVRAMGNAWAPYDKVQYAKDEPFGNVGAAVSRRVYGGVGLPELTDPFTKRPMYNVAIGDDQGIGHARVGMMLQEVLPFKTQNVMNTNDPIFSFFNDVGYEWNPRRSLQTAMGLKLSKDEQSIVSNEMYDVGNLPKEMRYWIKSTGNRLYKKYEKLEPKVIKTMLISISKLFGKALMV